MFDNDPRLQDVNQNRLSTGSIQTVSTVKTVDTRNSSVLPAASPNMGLSEEELEDMTASQTGMTYLTTGVARTAAERLNNTALSQGDAKSLKEANLLAQNLENKQRALRKIEEASTVRRKKRRMKYLIIFIMCFALLAIVGGVVGALMADATGDSSSAGTEQTPTTSPTTSLISMPTLSPTITLTLMPTTSPTNNPSLTPTANPTINPSTSSQEIFSIAVNFKYNLATFTVLCKELDQSINDGQVAFCDEDNTLKLCEAGVVEQQSISCAGASIDILNGFFCTTNPESIDDCLPLDHLNVDGVSFPILSNLFLALEACSPFNDNILTANCLGDSSNTVILCDAQGVLSTSSCINQCPCKLGDFFVPVVDFCEQTESECIDRFSVTVQDFEQDRLSISLATVSCEVRIVTLFDEQINFCAGNQTFVCNGNTLVVSDSCDLDEQCTCESQFSSVEEAVCANETNCDVISPLVFDADPFEILDIVRNFNQECDAQVELLNISQCIEDYTRFSVICTVDGALVETVCDFGTQCSCENSFSSPENVCTASGFGVCSDTVDIDVILTEDVFLELCNDYEPSLNFNANIFLCQAEGARSCSTTIFDAPACNGEEGVLFTFSSDFQPAFELNFPVESVERVVNLLDHVRSCAGEGGNFSSCIDSSTMFSCLGGTVELVPCISGCNCEIT